MNIQTVNYKDTSFINVTNPGPLEIKYLKNNFGFDMLHLDDYINKTQVPKIEVLKNYALLVLDFPLFSQNGQVAKVGFLQLPQATQLMPFSTSEKHRRIATSHVDLFIGKSYFVVLHDGALIPINDVFSLCQKTLRNRNEYMGEGPTYLAYRLIDVLVDSCFPVMNELSTTIDKIDKALANRQSQKTIEEISTTRRNIVVFQTMIKPIIPMFRDIEEGKYTELDGSMQPFWGNVVDHLQKLWDRLEDSRELIEGISSSNESLLTFRTNEIVKFLTVITSISFPFVVVNNLYSMNIVGLPYAQAPWIVGLLFSVILLSGLAIIAFFKYRRWI